MIRRDFLKLTGGAVAALAVPSVATAVGGPMIKPLVPWSFPPVPGGFVVPSQVEAAMLNLVEARR